MYGKSGPCLIPPGCADESQAQGRLHGSRTNHRGIRVHARQWSQLSSDEESNSFVNHKGCIKFIPVQLAYNVMLTFWGYVLINYDNFDTQYNCHFHPKTGHFHHFRNFSHDSSQLMTLQFWPQANTSLISLTTY